MAKPESKVNPETARTLASSPLPEAVAGERSAVEPVRDLSLTLPADKSDPGKHGDVSMRFVERGGEIYVSVRSNDADVADRLRGDLKSLAARFDEQGYRTESWRPSAGTGSSTSEDSGGQQAGSFSGGGGHSGQGERRRQSRPQPDWMEMFSAEEGDHK